ncbi:cyclic-di-AMP-binding protein CbpB [Vagococcus acidifermentans]|uniref:CBS domain-containing protein n=1 Tax=Vagococcus acidifermentans TaxID=564710 RepID=A0A430AXS9_9ENTE|nr:cyclic-di-AMP-binding protein CbpB [Vagococcus acidifermentans]RSU12863.1 hypothetical protein CBF27_04815 [Vagococcus acidifermentans]
MIGNAVQELLLENEESLMIDGENVATLLDTHPLDHALLVLTNIGYSKIPVLDSEGRYVGLISLSAVVEAMFNTTDIEPGRLADFKVADVMEECRTAVKLPVNIEKVLNLLVNDNFVVVTDGNDTFAGIITRREILKAVNHTVHELETRYHVTEKTPVVKVKQAQKIS